MTPLTTRRTAAAALLAALLGVAVLPAASLPGAAPARAAVVPSTPDYGPAIDAYPRYESELGCDSAPKPGHERVRDLLLATYGAIPIGLYRSCVQSANSGHDDNRALDWMTSVRNPAQRAMAESFLGWLQATDRYGNTHAMVRRMGIMYVIWNNRMWRAYDPGRGWTEYAGCLAAAKAGPEFDNGCHRNHVHLSFDLDGAWARTSYYTGAVPCPTPPAPAPAPAVATAGADFVPLRPTRVFSTRSSASGPCRVPARGRVDVPVLGVGGVPTSGVAAVALNVTAYRSDARTYLTVWPAGGARPAHSAVAAGPTVGGSGLVLVAPGADGRVSIANYRGATDVLVDVVGYLTTAEAGQRLHAMRPKRVLDTRTATLGPGESRTVDLASPGGLPSTGATGGLLSVTAYEPTGRGGLTVDPVGGPTSSLWDVVYDAGLTRANTVLTGLSGSSVVLTNRGSTPVRVLVDVLGWFAPAGVSGGARYHGMARAVPVLDTRSSVGVTGAMTPGRTATFSVTGAGLAPADAAMVDLNLSTLAPTQDTWLTLWRAGTSWPAVTTRSPQVGLPVGGLAAAVPGSGGAAALYNRAGSVDVVADLAGYWR